MATGVSGKKVSLGEQQETDRPVEEQIRLLAHEIWLQRGGQDGSEMDDWLQAEEQILSERNR